MVGPEANLAVGLSVFRDVHWRRLEERLIVGEEHPVRSIAELAGILRFINARPLHIVMVGHAADDRKDIEETVGDMDR